MFPLERRGAERAALDAALANRRRQRIGQPPRRCVPARRRRPAARRARPAAARCARPRPCTVAAMSHRLQQRAHRKLARPALEVVDAVAAGVERMDDHVARRDDLEAPRLGVVAARRPAREIEDLRSKRVSSAPRRAPDERGEAGVPGDGDQARLQRMALPPGRQVRLQPVLVGVEVNAPAARRGPGRGRAAPSAPRSRRCRRTARTPSASTGPCRGKIDPRRIDQVAHLQHRGRQADQEPRGLLGARGRSQPEVLLEGHLSREEHEQARRPCRAAPP